MLALRYSLWRIHIHTANRVFSHVVTSLSSLENAYQFLLIRYPPGTGTQRTWPSEPTSNLFAMRERRLVKDESCHAGTRLPAGIA